MTVSTSANSAVHRGNGAATEFPVPFKVLDEDDLVVRRRVFATGAYEHTYIGTDYSYAGTGDPSGTLTLAGDALLSTYELVIERIVSYAQNLDIVNAGGFYPETVEQQLDIMAMGIQQVADLAGRAAVVPVGEVGIELTKAADRAGKFSGFDAAGQFVALSGTGADAALRADLAASTGASLIKESGGSTLQVKLTALDAADAARPTSSTLLAVGGAALIGVTGGGTVQSALTAEEAARIAADGTLDDRVFDLEQVVVSGNVAPYSTWAALVAVTPTVAGERAEVIPTDTGTHTDPVVGGTVNNSGVFAAVDNGGLKWKRIYDYGQPTGSVPCTVGGTANAITMAPVTGYAVLGTTQVFTGYGAGPNSTAAVTVAIAGINGGAATALVMPNGDSPPAEAIRTGQPFAVRYVSATTKFVLVQADRANASVIMLNQTAGTGDAIIATIAHRGDWIKTDLNDTIFEVRVTGNKGAGAATLSILKPDGTTLIAATTIFQKDGVTAPPALAWETNDTIRVRRLASGFFALADPPSSAVRSVSSWLPALGDLGQRGSTIRPLMYTKAGDEQHFVEMRLHEDKYLNGQSRRQSDMLRLVLHDMANFQSIDGNLLSINSLMTRMRGLSLHDLNMQFTDLISGIVTNTGRSPTTIEPPIHGGKFGDAANLYVIAGAGHGSVDEPVSVVTGTYADASTSEVDTDVVIDPGAAIDYRFSGDKLVVETEMLCVNAAADVWCVQSHIMTLDPIATDQLRVQSEYDFDHADVTVTPGFIRGFGMLWAMTDVDRCQPIVNGVAQAIEIIDLRDDSENTIGFPEQVVFWHSDFPEKQIIVTNNFGFGFTHKENDVLVANDVHQAYIANGSDYVKLYSNLFGDHATATTRRDMTGIVVTQDFGVRVVLADPRI